MIELRHIGYVFGGLLLIYAFQVGRRRKALVRFRLKRIAVALLAYAIGLLVGLEARLPGYWPVAFAFFAALAAGFVLVRPHHVSRRIPKSVRAAVIARDLKGEPFDGTRYHLDHIVPVSRGGDHSVENLRVVPREENLRKGNQMPGFWDLFGRR